MEYNVLFMMVSYGMLCFLGKKERRGQKFILQEIMSLTERKIQNLMQKCQIIKLKPKDRYILYEYILLCYCRIIKNKIMLCYGAVHKVRHLFFEIFDPSLPHVTQGHFLQTPL